LLIGHSFSSIVDFGTRRSWRRRPAPDEFVETPLSGTLRGHEQEDETKRPFGLGWPGVIGRVGLPIRTCISQGDRRREAANNLKRSTTATTSGVHATTARHSNSTMPDRTFMLGSSEF
jgi:hypothetical protein